MSQTFRAGDDLIFQLESGYGFDTGEVWKASPMTYEIDGHQYIGVVAGSNVMVFGLP